MGISISGSVGKDGANKKGDVAIVQALLRFQKVSNFFKEQPTGAYGEDLADNITSFQKAKKLIGPNQPAKQEGLIVPNGATFRTLKSGVKQDLSNLKVHFHSGFKTTFFLRKNALKTVPKIPKLKEMQIPPHLGSKIFSVLQKAIIEFEVKNVDLTNAGEFVATFVSKEKFYDAASNKVIEKPSEAYFSNILKNIPVSDVKLSINPDGSIEFKTKKFPFFTGPYLLNAVDTQRWKSRKIPNPYKAPPGEYEKKLLSSIVRPWRKIVKKPDMERYIVKPNTVNATEASLAKIAGEILDLKGAYSKGVAETYKTIQERQNKSGKRDQLVLFAAGFELKLIIGLAIKVGILLDPNTEKEYFYLEGKVSLGAAASGGLFAEMTTLDKRIEDVVGLSTGISLWHKQN